MNTQAVVIHGPQGCGKTRNADALAKHFGCSKIIDDARTVDEAVAGTLYLCNSSSAITGSGPALVIPFDAAMRQAGISADAIPAGA